MDIKDITQRKSATITLNELSRLCRATDYEKLVFEIKQLTENGLLQPMGRNTNGMIPPLHNRYRIHREEPDDSAVKNEILHLNPEFNPSGYLSNISLYKKHRTLLKQLNDYLCTNSAELSQPMSKNERSYAIWHNEKQMDDSLCKSMLHFTGWENKLNFYNTPEPFFDYLCNGTSTKTVLILENKDIWFSLRRLFMENEKSGTLYGQKFDGLLYGEGRKINRTNALEQYSCEGFHEQPVFYYWGDIDYEGIDIYLKISAFPVHLFTPGYMAMLNYSRACRITQTRTDQKVPCQIDKFLNFFGKQNADEIQAILEEGKYIPQEICNYPRLRDAFSTAL